MKKAYIHTISKYIPKKKITNEDLLIINPNLNISKLEKKIGLKDRYISHENETATDMAYSAAENLFTESEIDRKDINAIILCTQSPDYFLPTSACILQDRLKLNKSTAAFDFNLGCSGYIYGLSIAKGLIEAEVVSNVLLITSETYSKYINQKDNSVLPIFGDAATATFLDSKESEINYIGPFSLFTDGSGYDKLIVKTGASRKKRNSYTSIEYEDEHGNTRSEDNLFMNGIDIFNFTIEEIPNCVNDFVKKNSIDLGSIDYFLFHQANSYMLSYIRDKLNIDKNKFYIDLASYGNTVSSTIPLAIIDLFNNKKLTFDQSRSIILCGFGVGLSWGITKINI